MKLFGLWLACMLSVALQAQNTTVAPAAGTPYIVNMSGIGELKIGMKKPAIEKLLGTTFKLKNLLRKDDWYPDTFNITYKNIPVMMVLNKNYIDENKSDFVIGEVRSSSPLLKTKSGITIGDDKLKIVTTYPDLSMTIAPEYEDADYTVKSKTRSKIWLEDDTGNSIIFYLLNGKVTSISVTYFEGD